MYNIDMKNKIHNIDVLEGFKNIEDESIDIIILDPPYNIGKDFGPSSSKMSLEDYVNWSLDWIRESVSVLKPSGTIFLYGFPEIVQHITVNIPIEKQRWLFWHYTNKTVPSLKYWQRSAEAIITIWKNKKERIFNLDDVREEYTESFIKNAAGKKRKNTKGRYGNKETEYKADPKGAMPRDVLKVPALAGGAGKKERDIYCKDCQELVGNKDEHEGHNIIEHPTQKPMLLTEKLILSSMNKEEENTVLIPFAGTGSECIVSKVLGCDFIGFEISEDYITLANERLKKYGY